MKSTRHRTVVFSAVASHPRWAALRELVREFAAPADLLRVALARVPGIDAAFIYGSFARATAVHEGSDVDVFVFGENLDQPEIRLALAEETLEVAGFLGREVT
jgi:predicted nucleotidyltransferase